MEPAASTIYALSFLAVAVAFAFAVYLHLWVKRQPTDNPTIRRVSDLIKAGANTFMRKEYKILAAFAGVAAVLIFLFLPQGIWEGDWHENVGMTLAYIAGTVLSAGKQGIRVSCGGGESLYLTELQAEGGKRMAAGAYLLGHPLEV